MIIVFGGQKGGTGKSTFCINCAVERIKEGREVLVIDTNYPQNSISTWCLLRDENKIEPRVSCVQKFGKNLSQEILSLQNKYDDILVDAGGFDSTEFRSSIAVADILASPIEAAQFSLWTIPIIDNMIVEAKIFNKKLKCYVFINAAPTNPSIKEEEDAISYLKECDLKGSKLLETIVYDRVIFRKVVPLGLSIIEYKSRDEKAISEFKSVYREIFK